MSTTVVTRAVPYNGTTLYFLLLQWQAVVPRKQLLLFFGLTNPLKSTPETDILCIMIRTEQFKPELETTFYRGSKRWCWTMATKSGQFPSGFTSLYNAPLQMNSPLKLKQWMCFFQCWHFMRHMWGMIMNMVKYKLDGPGKLNEEEMSNISDLSTRLFVTCQLAALQVVFE